MSKALEMEFIETPLKSKSKNKTNKPKQKEEVTDMNKQEYNKAKAHHKVEIKKLKLAIRKHKLLIKQAKLTYKLTQGE